MLRVEILDSADTLKLRLEGRFTGEEAEQTRMLTTRCRNGTRLIVDLTDVEFIDAVGEDVLFFFGRFGAEFVAPTSYTLDVCQRLHLPLAATGPSPMKTLSSSAKNDSEFRLHVPEPETN